MFTNLEVDRIKTEMKKKHNQTSLKIRLIWLSLFLFFAILMIIYQTTNWKVNDTDSTTMIFLIIPLIIFTIGFIVSLFYTSEKSFYEFLCKKVYQKIETDKSIELEYEAYDKDRSFLDKGKVLSSFAKTMNRRHLTAETEKGITFEIRDCYMSSGMRYQTKYFEGLYIIIHTNLDNTVQIRTDSKPDNSIGKKLKLADTIKELKVFKPIDKLITELDKELVDFVLKLRNTNKFNRVYLGVLDEEVHLVLSYYKQPVKNDVEVTKEKLDKLYNNLYSEYKLVNDFIEELDK